ncbi:MAG: selenide, water dikinase SelD [Bacillota bacterium]
MTSQQMEKRRRVMKRSMMLGHCICDVQQPCPCELFKQKDVCHCAGERVPVTNRPVRLTEHVRNAGCASKISKNVLHEVLQGLPEIADKRVVVGASAGDDAGVILLSDNQATILTVDVFCPSVDDPYTFGQIAAANSVSDIYAMGGTPQVALSIIGFPIHSLPAEAMREILRGGVEKMAEAGICVIGGHSINDEEVKCGFAVVGTSPKDGFVRNAGAQVGDAIVLTKPLGGGIVAFGRQVGHVGDEMLGPVARSMAQLNKLASDWMVKLGAHAATDVTGFSLMGHMAEIVRNSGVEATLDCDAIPLFEGVRELARQDVLPGAVERNRESVEEEMLEMSSLAAAQQAVLFCPETSGGLLVFLADEKANEYIERLHNGGVREARIIGRVTGEHPNGRIQVRTATAEAWQSLPLARAGKSQKEIAVAQEACCCAEGPRDEKKDAPATTGDVPPLPLPAAGDAFKAYMGAVGAPGALGIKQKKLISVALSVMSRCEPCVKINIKAAREAGATDEEIGEAVSLGVAFGGSPVAMFYSTLRK